MNTMKREWYSNYNHSALYALFTNEYIFQMLDKDISVDNIWYFTPIYCKPEVTCVMLTEGNSNRKLFEVEESEIAQSFADACLNNQIPGVWRE